MEDISKLVSYESAFPVELKNPITGESVGITFHVVSADAERVSAGVRLIETEKWRAIFESKDKQMSPEIAVKFGERAEREQLVHAITAWDFNGKGFGDLGADPECNEANKRYLVNHPNASWIRTQLASAVADLTNFMPESKKPAKSGSRK